MPAPVALPRGVILAGERGRRLAERRDDVVGEVFKIHGDRASGNRRLTEAIDRRLHRDVGKAEHRALHGGGNAGFQDVSRNFVENCGLRNVRRNSSSFLNRRSTSSAESAAEMSVEMATPATPM